jgi:NADPH2:quinone reductase
VLRVQLLSWSAPVEGQLLVKVRTCGVGLSDLLMTRGQCPLGSNPPVGPGLEVAGEVVAVANGSPFAVGDRVMGATAVLENGGGCSEYAYVREAVTQRVPAAVSDEEVAGFVIGSRAAYAGLAQRVVIAPGRTLLVLGAAGNTGASALQLGKALGARVIAVAGTAEKVAFCTDLGADHTINYRTSDLVDAVKTITEAKGADVIFDPVGGELATRAAAAVARHGQIATIGYASGSWLIPDPIDMAMRNYAVMGVSVVGTPAEDREAYGRLINLAKIRAIKLRPP